MADTCLRAGSDEKTNYGAEETMQISRAWVAGEGHAMGLLKFPLEQIPEQFGSVQLKLYVVGLDKPLDLMAWSSQRNDWDEYTVSYATDPYLLKPHTTVVRQSTRDIPIPISMQPVRMPNQWISLDVTLAVRQARQSEINELSIYLMSGDSAICKDYKNDVPNDRIFVASRESAHPPHLVLSSQSLQVQPSEHPIVLTTDQERSELERKLENWAPSKQKMKWLQEDVNARVAHYQKAPEEVLARMQLWWNDHHATTLEAGWNKHIIGWEGRALMPTLRWSPGGLPGNEAPWKMVGPPFDQQKTYDDGDTVHAVYNGELGDYDVKQSGAAVESINGSLAKLMLDAAFLYWYSGDEKVAELATDLMWQLSIAVYFTNTPHQQYAGVTSTETIHDRAMAALPLAYDFLFDYLTDKEVPTSIFEYAMRRSARTWLEHGYGANWTIWETSHMAPIALVLGNDSDYADGLGRQAVLNHILNEDVTNEHFDLRTHESLDTALEQYSPVTGLKSESPGYSQGSSRFPVDYLVLLRNIQSVDFMNDPRLEIIRNLPLNYYLWGDTLGHAQGFSDQPKRAPYPAMTMEKLAMMADDGKNQSYLQSLAGVYATLYPELVQGEPEGGQIDSRRRYSVTDICLSNGILANWPADLRLRPGRPRSYYTAVHNNVLGRSMVDAGPAAGMITVYGEGVGGHNQRNGLSMECHFLGKPLIVDWGGSSYQKTNLRWHLAAMPAHNTVVIRGFDADRPLSSLEVNWVEPMLDSHEGSRSSGGVSPDCNLIDTGVHYDFEGTAERKDMDQPYHLQGHQRRLVGMIRASEQAVWFVDFMHSDETGNEDLFHDYIYNPLGVFMRAEDDAGNTMSFAPIGNDEGFGTEAFEHVAYDDYTNRHQLKSPDGHWSMYQGSDDFFVHAYLAETTARRDVFMVEGIMSDLYGVSAIRKATAGDNSRQTCIVRQYGEAWDRPFVAVYEGTRSSERTLARIQSDTDQPEWQAMSLYGSPAVDDHEVHIVHNLTAATGTYTYRDIAFDAEYAVVAAGTNGLESLYLGEGRSIACQGYLIDGGTTTVAANLQLTKEGIVYRQATEADVRIGLPIGTRPTEDLVMTLTVDGKTTRYPASLEGSSAVATIPGGQTHGTLKLEDSGLQNPSRKTRLRTFGLP